MPSNPIFKWASGLMRPLFKEDTQMTNAQEKVSLRKWMSKPQRGTTSHLLGWWWVKNSKGWQGCGETRTLAYCWRQGKMVRLLVKTDEWFLKNLKIEWPYSLVTALLRIFPKNWNGDSYRHTDANVHSSRCEHGAKKWERAKGPSMDKWIPKHGLSIQ